MLQGKHRRTFVIIWFAFDMKMPPRDFVFFKENQQPKITFLCFHLQRTYRISPNQLVLFEKTAWSRQLGVDFWFDLLSTVPHSMWSSLKFGISFKAFGTFILRNDNKLHCYLTPKYTNTSQNICRRISCAFISCLPLPHSLWREVGFLHWKMHNNPSWYMYMTILTNH